MLKKLCFAAVVALCAVGTAQAATVTVTGNNPTTNTDGSTIPATGDGSLATLVIEYGTCNGTAFGTKVGEISRTAGAPGAAFSHALNLNPGNSCIRALISNTYGAFSAPSNVRSHTVPAPVPSAPSLNTISAAVYEPKANFHAWTFERGPKVPKTIVKIGAACEEERCVSDSREGNFCVISRLTQITPRPAEGKVLMGLCG